MLKIDTRIWCPLWCSGGHLPGDGRPVHISMDQRVTVSTPEPRDLYVSVEMVDRVDASTAVRLEGGASVPMSPAAAMQLAAALQAAAFAAVASNSQGGAR